MKESEVVVLLGGLSEFQHQQVNDVSVQMWANTLLDSMTVEFALGHVARHFAKSRDSLKPADLNRAWDEYQDREYQREISRLAAKARAVEAPTPKNRVPEWWSAAREDVKRGMKTPDGQPVPIGEVFASALALAEGGSSAVDPLEAHCGKKDCPCIHSSGCFKGWMDSDDRTVPCPVCRSSLATALSSIPAPGYRNESDFATLRNHAKSDHYEQA